MERTIITQLRQQNIDVWDAALEASPAKPPQELVTALQKYAHNTEYTPLTGIEGVSKQIKHIFGLQQNHFIYANGLNELIFVVQLVFGGTIVRTTPSRGIYFHTPAVELHTTYASAWKITAGQLNECFNSISGPILFLFSNPNNPTGIVYTPEEVAEIGAVCKRHDVIVLADEIYAQLIFNDMFVSIAVHHAKTICCSSISKNIGCRGFAWMAFPDMVLTLYKKTLETAPTIYSRPSAPIQYAMREFLQNESLFGHVCKQHTTMFKDVTSQVVSTMSKTKLLFVPTQAAWYLFVGFKPYETQLVEHGIHDDVELSNYLFQEKSILTIPGKSFKCSFNWWLRFSIVDFEHINSGLNRLIHWLETLG